MSTSVGAARAGSSGSQRGRPIPGTTWREDVAMTLGFRRDQLGFLTRLVRERGDVVRLRLLGVPLVMVNHPEGVQRVLVDNATNYDKETSLYRTVRPVLRNGLIGAVGGQAWHRQRRLMQPSFHRPKTAAFVANMTDETGAMLDRWQRSYGREDVVDTATQVGHLALRIVTRSLYGADVGRSTDAIERDFTTANQIMGRFFRFPFPPLSWPTPSHLRLRQLIRNLDTFIDQLIEQRGSRDPDRANLLTILADSVDEDTGYRMTPTQLHEEVLNIMVGGYETTTHAVCWLLHHVSRNPDVQQQMHDEIDEILGDRVPTFEDLFQMPYTRRVIDETLRLNTPAWQTMRNAVDDDQIGGYHVPAGSGIYINFLLLHRHRDFWPEPERFDPDRFLPDRVAQRPRNAYIPFAAGPRVCIGKHFALAELQVIVTMILQRFRISPPAGAPPVGMQPLITLRPNPGVQLVLEQR
ncbi:cytochrome P450 [Micromonospora sp. FIMYZ51]|uniref:cytochrome P450 n=1 Tax=Micromonospora sp. FIMYZ51 TaxID=3051832 RepID=UPI00311DF3FE